MPEPEDWLPLLPLPEADEPEDLELLLSDVLPSFLDEPALALVDDLSSEPEDLPLLPEEEAEEVDEPAPDADGFDESDELKDEFEEDEFDESPYDEVAKLPDAPDDWSEELPDDWSDELPDGWLDD